jgi:hypothetical protein
MVAIVAHSPSLRGKPRRAVVMAQPLVHRKTASFPLDFMVVKPHVESPFQWHMKVTTSFFANGLGDKPALLFDLVGGPVSSSRVRARVRSGLRSGESGKESGRHWWYA